jgi:hypothetical protein
MVCTFASIWYQLLHISMWASHTSIVFEMVTSKEYVHLQFLLSEKQKHLNPQSTHRVAIADFWRISHHDGKISPVLLRVEGAQLLHTHPHYYHNVQSCIVRSC